MGNRTYCGSIGAEYMHITDTEQKRWLQQKIESVQAKPEISRDEKLGILKGLTAADGMEKYLGSKFPGAKRLSRRRRCTYSYAERFNHQGWHCRYQRGGYRHGSPWSFE